RARRPDRTVWTCPVHETGVLEEIPQTERVVVVEEILHLGERVAHLDPVVAERPGQAGAAGEAVEIAVVAGDRVLDVREGPAGAQVQRVPVAVLRAHAVLIL